MSATAIIEALKSAADELTKLNGPDDEEHLIGNAFDGIVSALGYLKTWRERCEPEDVLFADAPKRFKLPPLPPRKPKPKAPAARPAFVCTRRSEGRGNAVICSVEVTTALNDDEREQTCTIVTCGECAHKTQSWGDSSRSVRRCLALLREECPEEQENFYKTDDGSEVG